MSSWGSTQGTTMFGTEGQSSSWSRCSVDNSGQLVSTFLSKNWQKHKKMRSNMFFVLLTVLRCSDSIFSLLKRVTDSSFLFSCKTSLFPPLPFLNLRTQIRCPQNPNTDLKSAVEQPLLIFLLKTFLTILTLSFLTIIWQRKVLWMVTS